MFRRVHHIAFVVEDLDAAAMRFETTFGMDLVTRDEMTGDFELEVALYRLGETIVELITPTTESGWVYEFWRDNGDGFFHIAFEVADIRESMAALEGAGIRFEHDEPQQGFDWLVATMNADDTLVPMQIVETVD
jgi:methylmalonyl-CoA/ethylmalonyl-CoA epimerase